MYQITGMTKQRASIHKLPSALPSRQESSGISISIHKLCKCLVFTRQKGGSGCEYHFTLISIELIREILDKMANTSLFLAKP